MLISFAMICSCQKQDSVVEQELAQRKAELDAREDALDERMNALDERVKALDERVNALAENEKSRANVQTISPDAQSQDVIPTQQRPKLKETRAIQQLSSDIRARDSRPLAGELCKG